MATRTIPQFRIIAHTDENKVAEFDSFDHWCDTAQMQFARAGVRGGQCICVDAFGRVCTKGAEFMRARDEDRFPVKVFLVSP